MDRITLPAVAGPAGHTTEPAARAPSSSSHQRHPTLRSRPPSRGGTAPQTSPPGVSADSLSTDEKADDCVDGFFTPIVVFVDEVPLRFQSWMRQMRKAAPWFPPDVRSIGVGVLTAADGGLNGITRSGTDTSCPKFSIELAIEPGDDSDPMSVGRVLYSFWHELISHAHELATAKSEGYVPLPGDVHHVRIFAPPDQSNGYHTSIKSALRFVPDAARTSFLQEYARDVKRQADFDCDGKERPPPLFNTRARGDELLRTLADAWHVVLFRQAAEPNGPFWAYEPPPVRAMSDSSGLEDDTDLPGGSNPLPVTGLHLSEAISLEWGPEEQDPSNFNFGSDLPHEPPA